MYEGLLDGIVCDEGDPEPPPEGLESLRLPDPDGGKRRAPLVWPCGRSSSPPHCAMTSKFSVGMKTVAVLPVKRLDTAHSRLAGVLDPEQRARLAEATFLDALSTLRQCAHPGRDRGRAPRIRTSPGRRAGSGASSSSRARTRGTPTPRAPGVRAALELGADRVAILPTDCPLMDAAEIDDRLGRTPRAALIVPDRHGTGTNCLVLSPPDAFEPAFGPDSCARHVSRARATGISFALEELDSLALDLDTPEDMQALRDALLLAPERALRSAQVLWELGSEAAQADGSSSQSVAA